MPNAASHSPGLLQTLAVGDVLFKEGDLGDVAYVVESGVIEISRFTGEEYVTLRELEAGALFGELALIDNQPRSAIARAATDAGVREVGKEDFLKYLKSSPQAAFGIMQQLAESVRAANETLSVDAFSSSPEDQLNSETVNLLPNKVDSQDQTTSDLLESLTQKLIV